VSDLLQDINASIGLVSLLLIDSRIEVNLQDLIRVLTPLPFEDVCILFFWGVMD
jgi:hypothetical protein